MADSTISNLPLYTSPQPNDVLPIVPAIGNVTSKITVGSLVANAPAAAQPFCSMSLQSDSVRNAFFSSSAGGCNNATNYIVPFSDKIETSASLIEGDLNTETMIIKTTGKYLITGRVGFYDLFNNSSSNVYQSARLRLVGNTSPFFIGPGGTYSGGGLILSTLAISYAPSFYTNGEFTIQGSHILLVTSVPYYLLLNVYVNGGSANTNSAAYMVASGTPLWNGNNPQFTVQKLSN